ncbi:PLP-dependent aminotransferase family protein [Starkeya sp. ORNL1]|uniref:aminotransferase-like domain-containing protein n=1 Tax=Starkeya sp. ORNL1 TaxID=2709380 RepID=UPI0014647E19|nr:PLP-dependent aminotransferase family protein [Starkeya sp. ORNL1]QJP16870.1 PLP-dependent aminotransferase family protein [Starkeya sp. ORNL1]
MPVTQQRVGETMNKHDGVAGTEIAGSSSEMSWTPRSLDRGLAPYLALLQALEDDVRTGALPPGTQLPPHRALASHLGLSLSTVTKAYREAGIRGVVVGRVGQGTFVAAPDQRQSSGRSGGLINLGINLSPAGDQREALRTVFAELARGNGLDGLFAYDAQQGLAEHRAGLADWIATPGFRPSPEQILATNGAQHGLDLALSLTCAPGETILVEDLTYVGFKALADLHGYRLEPVAMDEEGLVPEALEERIRETRARLVYAMPTLHSPTARTMSPARRQRIAEIIERHGLRLIEDDVYGFLLDTKPEPIAGLIPERTLYLSSFSKIFELGFRAGTMAVPAPLIERARLAVRASTWSATPLLFEVALRMVRTGVMERLVRELRQESRRRHALFRKIFPGQRTPHDGALSGYHAWLELPNGWTAADLFFAARNDGVLITPPGSASVAGRPEAGVRLCLGAAGRAELERALAILRQLIDRPAGTMYSVA